MPPPTWRQSCLLELSDGAEDLAHEDRSRGLLDEVRGRILSLQHVLRIAHAREVQGDFVFDDIGEIERKLLACEITSDVARTLIWSKQWRAAKLAQKRYGDRAEVYVNTTIDVADRITRRWKENLSRLNAEQPLTIEGEKVDVTPNGNRIN